MTVFSLLSLFQSILMLLVWFHWPKTYQFSVFYTYRFIHFDWQQGTSLYSIKDLNFNNFTLLTVAVFSFTTCLEITAWAQKSAIVSFSNTMNENLISKVFFSTDFGLMSNYLFTMPVRTPNSSGRREEHNHLCQSTKYRHQMITTISKFLSKLGKIFFHP